MKISISAKHGQLADDVQQSIQNKVERLPRFFDRTTGIDVIVDLERAEHPRVELKVSAEETDDFFAAGSATNILSALDSVVHKIERQLTKHKEKLINHRASRQQRNGQIDLD